MKKDFIATVVIALTIMALWILVFISLARRVNSMETTPLITEIIAVDESPQWI